MSRFCYVYNVWKVYRMWILFPVWVVYRLFNIQDVGMGTDFVVVMFFHMGQEWIHCFGNRCRMRIGCRFWHDVARFL